MTPNPNGGHVQSGRHVHSRSRSAGVNGSARCARATKPPRRQVMASARLRHGTFLIVAAWAVAVRLEAHNRHGEGIIEGTVVDVHGAPIAGIDVTAATLWSHPAVVKTVSDAHGRFRLESVPAERFCSGRKNRSRATPHQSHHLRACRLAGADRERSGKRSSLRRALDASRAERSVAGHGARSCDRQAATRSPRIDACGSATTLGETRRDDHVEGTNVRGKFIVGLPHRPSTS